MFLEMSGSAEPLHLLNLFGSGGAALDQHAGHQVLYEALESKQGLWGHDT